MARLYKHSNIIFEIMLYLLVTGSYFNWDNIMLFFFVLSMITSILVSGFPSAYYQVGYCISKRRTDIDGLCKVTQLFIILWFMPLLGIERIGVGIVLLAGITIGGIFNRIIIYKQIIMENIKFYDLVHKMKNQKAEDKKKEDLLDIAWKTVLPFFLLGLLDNNRTISLIVFCIILLSEYMILKKLYLKLIAYSSNENIKRDFYYSLIKAMIYMVFLIVISISDPMSLLSFVLVGFYTAEFVNLIHREKSCVF